MPSLMGSFVQHAIAHDCSFIPCQEAWDYGDKGGAGDDAPGGAVEDPLSPFSETAKFSEIPWKSARIRKVIV